MPPRVVKRGAAAAGSRRTARASRTAAEGQNQKSEAPEEMPSTESGPAIDEPVMEQQRLSEKAIISEGGQGFENGISGNSDSNGSASVKKGEDAKESLEDYERDERLELDDNEPEYEPEEYAGVDSDDKEIELEDVQEVEGDEVEEELEEHVVEEEEGDLVEEELEDVAEDFEGEGEDGDQHTGEGSDHAETVYAEEDEHHEHVKERRKRKEFEIFVGGLDKDATEEDLKKVFSRVGDVTEVRLMMNPQTKKNKGFAFLRFATVEQAKRAVSELKNPVINGKQCGVTPSQDSDTLFLGNICKTWTKEALKEKLKHYGVNNVEDLTLVEDGNNEGMNRGFAFLEFQSRSDAMDAFKRLQKRDVLFGVDRPAKVSFADSFIDPGDEIMAQVKTVFIDGLPASWDEDRVRVLLKRYGEIEKIELARNMPSAKRKDFGFVTFDSHDAAVTCAKSINNADLGEGDNKCKVRARLSRPLERRKGKHSSRATNYRSSYGSRVTRGPWANPTRGLRSRAPPPSVKRPVGLRERRPPVVSMPVRSRPLPPPPRSYDRRAPAPSYSKSSLKREYGRRDELPPPRSRAPADYGSRVVLERRPSSYSDDYSSRGSGYSDIPRGPPRSSGRRAYVDDGYDPRFERHPSNYRDERPRAYDSLSGLKRPYSTLDDAPPRYAEASSRHSRSRLDYELGPSGSQYGDVYSDRMGRSNAGYGSSRSSIPSQDPHGLYNSRQGMSYGGSYSSSDVGRMYPSNYDSGYMSRGGDVPSRSYSSSMYPGRGMGGSSYMGSGGSGSYY